MSASTVLPYTPDRMGRPKTVIFLKLSVLIGGPLLVLMGLMGVGVYLGDRHREKVLSVESMLLGRPVVAEGDASPDKAIEGKDEAVLEPKTDADGDDAPTDNAEAALPKPAPGSAPGESSTPSKPTKIDEAEAGSTPTVDVEDTKHDVASDGARALPPSDAPAKVLGSATAPRVEAPVRSPAATLPPIAVSPAVPDDLLGAYAASRTLELRVLVDDTVVATRPDWIDYVQRHVSVASANLKALVGVELRLRSVGHADGAIEDAVQALTELQSQHDDGADVVLLLGTRTDVAAAAQPGIPAHASGAASVVAGDVKKLGRRAVVLGEPVGDYAHVPGMLHELGHLLGAVDITDVREGAWTSGSFMSFAALPERAAPALDVDNLRRILSAKSWPLADDDDLKETRHGN